MLEFIVYIILIQALVFGLFSGFIATQKNRSGVGWFITGFFFSFLAIFALIAVPKKQSEGEQELILSENDLGKQNIFRQNDFQGERIISSSKYQLFLVERYKIEKNITLEKYVFNNDAFDSLEDVLTKADEQYQRDLEKNTFKNDALDGLEDVLTTANEQAQRDLEKNIKAKKEYIELEQSINSEAKIVMKRVAIFLAICLVLFLVFR